MQKLVTNHSMFFEITARIVLFSKQIQTLSLVLTETFFKKTFESGSARCHVNFINIFMA